MDRFGFRWLDISDRPQQSLVVVPVHPVKRGQFHLLAVAPRAPVNHLCVMVSGSTLPQPSSTLPTDVLSPRSRAPFPGKARPKKEQAAARKHHTQVSPEQLTRTFADVRDSLEIGGDNPLTFHEIRSLGGALLMTERGWTNAQVQALMGDASEAVTTAYLKRPRGAADRGAAGAVTPAIG